MIRWQSSLSCQNGIPIKSPLTGFVLPISSHPDLLYNSNVLPSALCIQMTQGTLLAPFSGRFGFSLLGNRRITMKHQTGLGMVIDLKSSAENDAFTIMPLKSENEMKAGQPLATFDLSGRRRHKHYAAVMLMCPAGVSEIVACQRSVTAGTDPLFILHSA